MTTQYVPYDELDAIALDIEPVIVESVEWPTPDVYTPGEPLVAKWIHPTTTVELRWRATEW